MAPPRLGRMRERLAILQRTATTDTQGGRAVVWSTLDSVAAELLPLQTTERLQAQAIQAQVDSRFRIRTRGDVTPDMRAQWRPSWLALATPKTLEIHGVLPDPEAPSAFLLLECAEVAA